MCGPGIHPRGHPQLARWLINLTGSNCLLNFKPSRTGSVELTGPPAEQVLARCSPTAPWPAARTASASGLTPYLDPMPSLVDYAVDATGGGTVKLTTALISRKVHRQLPATTLFGYLQSGGPGAGDTRASYLGPPIVAKSGQAVKVKYTNDLAPDAFLRVFTNGGASYLQFPPFPEVRTMTHLHGAFVAGEDDGNPFAQPDASGPGRPSR